MSRRKICLWLLVFLPCLLPSAEEAFNLQRFVSLAVRNNQAIQIAQDSIAGAEQKVAESKSAYYPQLGLSAAYSRVSMVSEFDLAFGGQTYHFNFSTPDNYSLRLTASQQLFNWGRSRQTVKMSRLGADLARDAVDSVRQLTAYQVVPIYYNLLFAGEALKVLNETEELFRQKLKIFNARYEAGLVSDFDLSLIQVQLSVVASQKAELNNSLRKLTTAYNRIADRPLEAELVIDDRLDFQPQALDEPQLLREALANRVEFQQLRDQEALLAAGLALARTGNKPMLTANVTYELRNGFLPEVNQMRGNWTLSLAAAYPLFDGFRSRAQVAQARIGLDTVQRQRRDQEGAVAAEIRQLLSDNQTLEEKISIENVKIGHAQKALKIAEERSAKGLISTTDLIEAQDTLSNSRLNVLQMTMNYILNRYSLFRAVGRKIYQE
jgi:outer membrane protein